ncbi:MAG: LysR family transcriptional regulator [Oscillospiraceae bacterium]|jgi:DNA-binding transcriptional LysR family regulator|nr:LysR family transcriptional regulator [Oscillospiraceae bacterium]
MSDITLQQIQAFLEIAKCRSLSKAANEMYISQPALSKMLRRLEAGIGLPLFFRNNQGVELTEAGRGLYLAFKSLHDNLELTISWARRMTFARKFLHIAVPLNFDCSANFAPLKDIISKYEKKYADVTVMETLLDLKYLCQSLEFGGIDLIFAPSYAVSGLPYIKRRHVFDFRYCIAVPADFPAQSLDDPQQFNNMTLFAMPSVDDIGDTGFAERVCRELGFVPSEIKFPPNPDTIFHAVRRGLGVGLCWLMEPPGAPPNIRFLPLNTAPSDTCLDAVWNPDKLSQEAQRLLNMIPRRDDLPDGD